jgi:hypothetical protein
MRVSGEKEKREKKRKWERKEKLLDSRLCGVTGL